MHFDYRALLLNPLKYPPSQIKPTNRSFASSNRTVLSDTLLFGFTANCSDSKTFSLDGGAPIFSCLLRLTGAVMLFRKARNENVFWAFEFAG